LSFVHLSYPKRSMQIFLHLLEQVDQPLARSPCEHGYNFPWKTGCGYFLDKVQRDSVLDCFPKEVGLYESWGAAGGFEDVDAVVFRPLPVVVRVRVVSQSASIRDAVNLEGSRRVPGMESNQKSERHPLRAEGCTKILFFRDCVVRPPSSQANSGKTSTISRITVGGATILRSSATAKRTHLPSSKASCFL
jgi:hypothetical protein